MIKFLRFLSIIILFPFFTNTAYGQFTPADSIYMNSICNEGMYISYWNHPGIWFHHPEVSSVQNFYDQLDSSFVFHNDEFADCYRKMSTSDILERDTVVNQTIDNFENNNNTMLFGHKDPFVKVKFSLNNKVSYSYALLDSSSKPVYNNDHAFVIISGTGNNQLKTIFDGAGYHNTNCHVRNLLRPLGDIYYMSTPNEDHRAIYFNKKKASSTTGYPPSYFNNYLNAANKAAGLTRLIETVAFIKHLKSKYKKVFVMGLSTGGKVAFWASLLSEPDASLVASGYSVLVDQDYYTQLANTVAYGNYMLVYDKDSSRARVRQLYTQFLITQALNDGPLVMNDINNSITKNFYNNVDNVSFNYTYYNHSFPPCPVIDSFLQQCISKAKVFLSSDTTVCNNDSVVLKLSFFGKAPFSFQLYRDTALVSNYTSADTNFNLTIFDEGNYLIKNIIDSAGIAGYRSDTFKYKKSGKPLLTLTKKDFVCDSNKTNMVFDFQGLSPFSVSFTKDNITDSLLFYQGKDSILLPGGNYSFSSVQDASHCNTAIQDSVQLTSNNLNLTISAVQYNCLSNLNELSLNSAGLLPLTLIFYDSLISSFRYEVLSSHATTLYLDSGAYKFISIKDSNNCIKVLDTSMVISTEPVSLTYDALQYNCSDNFAVLPIHLKGKGSWAIEVESGALLRKVNKNNANDTIQLRYGISKIIKITDDHNCMATIKDSVISNPYVKLSASVFTQQYDCILGINTVELFSTGNYPMRVFGYKGGVPMSELIFTSPATYNIVDGYFRIDSIFDDAQCILQNVYESGFMNDSMFTDALIQDKLKLKALDTSFSKYFWFMNGQLIKETEAPYIDIEHSGVYETGVYNSNHCFLRTMKLVVNLEKISIFPNPADDFINILVQFDPSEKIDFSLLDLLGNKIAEGQLKDGMNRLNLPELQRGVYILNLQTNKNNVSYPAQRIFKN